MRLSDVLGLKQFKFDNVGIELHRHMQRSQNLQAQDVMSNS